MFDTAKEAKESDFGDSLSQEAAERDAAKADCYIVLPKPNELFVDIDSEEAMQLFQRNVKRLADFIDLGYEVKPSKSGGECRHITVTLARHVHSEYERIAMQAFLGSDPRRELLSWARVETKQKNPTKFFEKLPELLR